MKKDNQEIQLNKAIRYSLIWFALWGTKIFFFGGSPFILLISTSIVFAALYKSRSY
jgi:hypothetical protein